jgi:hypothetical protein
MIWESGYEVNFGKCLFLRTLTYMLFLETLTQKCCCLRTLKHRYYLFAMLIQNVIIVKKHGCKSHVRSRFDCIALLTVLEYTPAGASDRQRAFIDDSLNLTFDHLAIVL